jgi:hypothetical protein
MGPRTSTTTGRPIPPLVHRHRKLSNMFTAPFVVLRLLTPLGMSYEAAVKRAEPYNRIIQELSDMRADTIRLVQQAVAEQRHAYVLVNNRLEGSAAIDRSSFSRQTKGPGHGS